MLKPVLYSLFLLGLRSCVLPGIQADDAALDLFRLRITPILRAPNASSCAECHLSGVDLKDYIGATQEQTFASLNAAGLIDRDNPDQSKLLRFIQRSPDKPTPVGEKVGKQEYEAFRAWIHAAVKNPKLAAAKTDSDQLGPAVPLTVIRHTRQDRVLQSFVEDKYKQTGGSASQGLARDRGSIGTASSYHRFARTLSSKTLTS